MISAQFVAVTRELEKLTFNETIREQSMTRSRFKRIKSPKNKTDNVHVLSNEKNSIANVQYMDEAPLGVVMDWGRGNLAFTLANYRSLESVLAHHPNAKVWYQTQSYF